MVKHILMYVKQISIRIINLSLATIIGLSSLVAATPILFSASASATPLPVTNITTSIGYATIQAAIDGAGIGDTINVGAGIYSENLSITKSLNLVGAGQAFTTIYPAVSNPTGTNNVITIQADNVNLHDFTIDGANPSLVGGVSLGGASVNANRGIMTDPSQNHTNIAVHDVTVKNIYLRGIQLGGSSSTPSFIFSITHNTVQNVKGDINSSIAIFNRGGAGEISNNNVSGTPDAISANNSRGTQFLNNVITNSASGIHTDNAGGSGGTSDLIQGNQISNGVGDGLTGYPVTGSFGIWVLAPYQPVIVDSNTITNVMNGLAVFGQGAAVTTQFTNNHVDLSHLAGSRGAFVTTDQIGNGTQNVSASFIGNTIDNAQTGLYTESTISKIATVTAHSNAIAGYVTAYNNTSSTNKDAINNYWGSAAPGFSLIVVGTVTYDPYFTDSLMTTRSDATVIPDSSGNATVNNTVPQVVVTSASQPVNITVASGTNNATIDFSSLISGNTGTIPKTTVNTTGGSISIPAATTVTATSATGEIWDGVINAPTIKLNTSVSIPTPTGLTVTVATVIDVGSDSDSVSLTFDKAVRLFIPGQADKLVGFVRNGVFTQILTLCLADTQAEGNALAAGGNCYVNVGSDMVVWTKHFTKFVTYNQTKAQTYTVVSGDTLSSIGVSVGVDWQLIASTNGITAPYTIYPGQVLKLPGGSIVAASVTTSAAQSAGSSSAVLGESSNPQIGTALSTTSVGIVASAVTPKANWFNWYLFFGGAVVLLVAAIYYVYQAVDKKPKK